MQRIQSYLHKVQINHRTHSVIHNNLCDTFAKPIKSNAQYNEQSKFKSKFLRQLAEIGGLMRIFLIGFMGCGKSHWGKQLSQKLQIPYFDLDEKIEEHEARNITEIFAEEGEEYFRLLEKDVLHLLTENHESFIMATGGGTPCFYNTIDYLKQKGTTVWINCSVDCLYNRLLKEKDKRPLIRSIPDAELKAYIIKKYSTRKIYYQQASVIISDEEVSLEKLVSTIFKS